MTLLAGRGGGTLTPGRYLKYDGLVQRHGDSTGRLTGLNI